MFCLRISHAMKRVFSNTNLLDDKSDKAVFFTHFYTFHRNFLSRNFKISDAFEVIILETNNVRNLDIRNLILVNILNVFSLLRYHT